MNYSEWTGRPRRAVWIFPPSARKPGKSEHSPHAHDPSTVSPLPARTL